MDIDIVIITIFSYISVLGVIGVMINKSQVTQEIQDNDLPKVNNDICWYSGLPSTSSYNEEKGTK